VLDSHTADICLEHIVLECRCAHLLEQLFVYFLEFLDGLLEGLGFLRLRELCAATRLLIILSWSFLAFEMWAVVEKVAVGSEKSAVLTFSVSTHESSFADRCSAVAREAEKE
jgi:hypothetical protein